MLPIDLREASGYEVTQRHPSRNVQHGIEGSITQFNNSTIQPASKQFNKRLKDQKPNTKRHFNICFSITQ
jgi:hypothetical protein